MPKMWAGYGAPLSDGAHVADKYDELQQAALVELADLDELVDDDAAVASLNETSS